MSASSSDVGALTVSPASRTYTPSNYGTGQAFQITGVQDSDEVNETVTVTFSASGADYADVEATASITLMDDDYSFVFSGTDDTITEGTTASYNLKLSRQPDGTVTVSTSSGNTNAITVSAGATRTFTTSNWNSNQTVTLSAQQDVDQKTPCLLYTSPSPRDRTRSRMPSSA